MLASKAARWRLPAWWSPIQAVTNNSIWERLRIVREKEDLPGLTTQLLTASNALAENPAAALRNWHGFAVGNSEGDCFVCGSRCRRVDDISRGSCRSAQSNDGEECHGEVSELHVGLCCGDLRCLSEKSG